MGPFVAKYAAFDHRHIFIDPDPDPAASFEERLRLFTTPRTSWEDYDASKISFQVNYGEGFDVNFSGGSSGGIPVYTVTNEGPLLQQDDAGHVAGLLYAVRRCVAGRGV